MLRQKEARCCFSCSKHDFGGRFGQWDLQRRRKFFCERSDPLTESFGPVSHAMSGFLDASRRHRGVDGAIGAERGNVGHPSSGDWYRVRGETSFVHRSGHFDRITVPAHGLVGGVGEMEETGGLDSQEVVEGESDCLRRGWK